MWIHHYIETFPHFKPRLFYVYIFSMWIHCYLGMYPHYHHYYRNVSTISRHQVSQNVDVATLSPLYRDVSTLARHWVSSYIDVYTFPSLYMDVSTLPGLGEKCYFVWAETLTE